MRWTRGLTALLGLLLLACAMPTGPRLTAQTPSGAHPNEPAGFMVSRVLDGVVPKGMPAHADPAYRGVCYGSAVSNASLSNGVIQVRFPAGLPAGRGPVNFGCYDQGGAAVRLSAVYLSLEVQLVGPTYENQKTGTKLFYLASGRKNGAENELFLLLKNAASLQGAYSAFPLQVLQQGVLLPSGTVNRTLSQNLDRRALLTAGTWHHFEAVLVDNAIGQANGQLRLWLDGIAIVDYANLVYRTPANPLGFGLLKFDMIWGGQVGTRTRADFVQFRNIYVSGLP